MRIFIDGLGVSELKGTGLGTYTAEFISNLLQMYPQPKYDFICDGPDFEMNPDKYPNVSFLNLHVNRLNNDYSNIEDHIESSNIDIYHSPNNGFSIPENKKCSYIATVQDLLPVVNSDLTDEKYKKKFNAVFPNVIKNCDKFIVFSESLREQLKNYFDVPDKNIMVNYPGCSNIFTPKSLESCENILSSKYKIEGDFILYAGSIHIRKNLENLIEAFAKVKIQHKDLSLLIVGSCLGKRREYYEKLKSLAEDLKLQDSVIFTGAAEYSDMPYFYSKAKCVLNLSKYEGFPLSSIEAMACNTPVIWNEVSFFREAFGGTGLTVDANDQDRLKDAILNILCSHSLRESIIKEQRELTSKYTWEKHIKNTVRLYETFY